MVHCQDAKKIPPPLGAVSWLTSKESTLKPAVTVLGASTMHRTMQNYISMTMGLSVEDIVVAGEDASRAVDPSIHPSGSSQLDVTSATRISVSPRSESDTVELDLSWKTGCVWLLLAVYVRWKSGSVISSDWLRPVTRGAWRAVLSDWVEEPNPSHGPGESSWLGPQLYKGPHTDCWTIVSDKATSSYPAVWTVLLRFRIDWCALWIDYCGSWNVRYTVCVEEDRKEDWMDTPGFALPICAYRHNLCEMRKSHDASESEPTALDSLGVLDLDLTVCPDAFGLKAFDDEMPVT